MWLRVFDFVWEDLGSSLMYINYELFFIVIFNNMYEYGIDDVNYFALEGITKCELA